MESQDPLKGCAVVLTGHGCKQNFCLFAGSREHSSSSHRVTVRETLRERTRELQGNGHDCWEGESSLRGAADVGEGAGSQRSLTVLSWRRGFDPGTWWGSVARAPTGRHEPSPRPSWRGCRPTPKLKETRWENINSRSSSVGGKMWDKSAFWAHSAVTGVTRARNHPSKSLTMGATFCCPLSPGNKKAGWIDHQNPSNNFIRESFWKGKMPLQIGANFKWNHVKWST